MKPSLRFVLILVPLLLAAGCARTPAPPPPSPPPPNPPPTATSTAAMFSKIGPGSATGTSLFEYTGTPAFRFSASGTILGSDGSSGTALSVIDLGTAVKNPGTKFAPGRTLEIYVVSKDDARLNGCYFSGAGWEGGISPDKNTAMINGNTFCVTTTTDAGAGNRYNVKTYALTAGDRAIVFQFVVHSVVCENYPNPAAQCFSYDEARDMSGFDGIMQTLTVE